MRESPNPLSSSEMREQFQRFAELNDRSQAARSARYELGIPHPDAPSQQQTEAVAAVSPDLSQPVTPDDWQCSRCGAKLAGSSLKIYNSRFAFGGQDMAMCPHCGGPAYNLHQEALRQVEQFTQQRLVRRNHLRNGIICGAAGGLFLLSPSTWTYLLCWIVAFWFGPLTEIHLKMKLGAVFTIMWAGFFGTFVIGVLGMGYLGKLGIWLLITMVLVAAGWLIEKVAAFGGGLFYKG